MGRLRTDRELAYRGGWPKLSKFVIARDRGICHICRLPGADTADHIDPVSERGPGLPLPDRCAAAHRACNSRRARLLEKRNAGGALDEEENFSPSPPRRDRLRRPPRVWIGAIGGEYVASETVDVIERGGVVVRLAAGQRYVRGSHVSL